MTNCHGASHKDVDWDVRVHFEVLACKSFPPRREKRKDGKGRGGGKGSLANQAIFALQRTYAADYIGFAMLVTCYMLVSLPTSQIGRATDTVA